MHVGEAVTLQLALNYRCSLAHHSHALLTFLSLTTLEALHAFSVGLHQQAVGVVILREFVSQCAAVTAVSLAEDGKKGSNWFYYQLVAAGQHNTVCATAAATDSPTPHLPALPVLCL